MVVLDTDHLSLLEWKERPDTQLLRERLNRLPVEEVTATIISFEEQARGWLTYLAQTRSMAQQIEAYRRLRRQLENYCRIVVLEFDERAATEFQRLRQARMRVSTMDLTIAAIALSR